MAGTIAELIDQQTETPGSAQELIEALQALPEIIAALSNYVFRIESGTEQDVDRVSPVTSERLNDLGATLSSIAGEAGQIADGFRKDAGFFLGD